MENNKILILREEENQYFLKYVNSNIQPIYKKRNNIISKMLFKILFKLNSRFLSLFFENWKKEINKYKQIIVFDANYRKSISKYIKKHNKSCNIILYYWNIVDKDNKIIFKDKNITEIWTFDYDDSIKYGLKYNPQFYSKNIKLEKEKEEIDVYFLGKNKGRKAEINKIEKLINEEKLVTKFIIMEDEDKQSINYDDYLKEIEKSKSILDILTQGQSGLTLRCLEALFFEKKLITNNVNITKYNFYSSNNIFIIGKDNINNIKEFISKPYKKIDKKIIDYYNFESWLKRFKKVR